MTEAGPAIAVAEPVDDADIDADDDLEIDLAPEPPPPSIAPGPRRLMVPEGEVVRRVDRFVADRTGLSRSYVQKLITEGRLVDDDGPPAARELRGPRRRRHPRGPAARGPVPSGARPQRSSCRVVYEDDDLLIVDKPRGPRRPPGARALAGHARERAPRARRPLRRHRGRRATRHRPPPRPRHVRAAHRRPQRRRPGLADGPAQGPPRAEDLPRARPGLGVGAAVGPDRGADRARPQGPQADGRRPRRPGAPRRATGSASGSPAGRCSSST